MGSQNNLMTSFTPKSMTVGTTISLQSDYRYTGVPIALPQGNFIRFGLYDSHGTESYADDTGFHADITHFDNATPGTGGFYQLRQESNSVDLFAGLLLDNPPGVLTAPPPDSDGSTLFTRPKSVSDGTSVHTARLQIRRDVAGMTLELYVKTSRRRRSPVSPRRPSPASTPSCWRSRRRPRRCRHCTSTTWSWTPTPCPSPRSTPVPSRRASSASRSGAAEERGSRADPDDPDHRASSAPRFPIDWGIPVVLGQALSRDDAVGVQRSAGLSPALAAPAARLAV